MRYYLVWIFVLLMFSLPSESFGQSSSSSNRVFHPDLPGFTISPLTSGKGLLITEIGLGGFVRTDESTKLTQLDLPEALIRYGIFPGFEVFVHSGFNSSHLEVEEVTTDSVFSGMGATSAGFKVEVADEKGLRPAMSILGRITFRHIGNPSYAPTFSFPVGLLLLHNTISPKFGISYNIGFGYNGENADGFFIYGIRPKYEISGRLSWFAELFGNFDNGDFPNHRASTGFIYRVSDNWYIHLTAGTGFDKNVSRNSAQAGFSWGIPLMR